MKKNNIFTNVIFINNRYRYLKFTCIFLFVIFLFIFFLNINDALAQKSIPIPSIKLGVEKSDDPEDVALSVQILLFMTVLTLAPTILIMLTSFTRIIVVLSFTRNALATQQAPPIRFL